MHLDVHWCYWGLLLPFSLLSFLYSFLPFRFNRRIKGGGATALNFIAPNFHSDEIEPLVQSLLSLITFNFGFEALCRRICSGQVMQVTEWQVKDPFPHYLGRYRVIKVSKSTRTLTEEEEE